jgi:hypothetical protein
VHDITHPQLAGVDEGEAAPNDALPADFARIPPQSLAGAVLPTVAGTPQAQEAVINRAPATVARSA